MPLSDASTTRAPWSAAHAKAAAMSHARPLPDASRARSGTMPAFGAPQVMSPLPWVPSVSARRAAHARSREAKREPGVLRKRRLDFVRCRRAADRHSGARTRAKAGAWCPAFRAYGDRWGAVGRGASGRESGSGPGRSLAWRCDRPHRAGGPLLCRQLDRELGAGRLRKAVVGGGAHGLLLLGVCESDAGGEVMADRGARA
jgi:hypothetical protein